jgi:hypothetical protein
MHSILRQRESDPHDAFAIAPETVPAAWADKVLADITRDATLAPDQPTPVSSSAAAAAAPTVDTTFRATAASDLRVANDRPVLPPSTGSGAKSKAVVFLFALCSALAAAGWQHYGGAARQMIAAWTPPFALTSSPSPEPTGLTGQPDTLAVQASETDQTPPQTPAAAQPPQDTGSAAAAASPDTAQMQSMARDLAAMGQQVELLKASLAELKSNQQAMARDVAKPSESKPSESKPSENRPSEVKPLTANPRPKMSALPPRPAAAPARRPMPAYPPMQAAAPPPLPQQLAPPASLQPAPPPAQAQFDGDEPVVRPPMPLR